MKNIIKRFLSTIALWILSTSAGWIILVASSCAVSLVFGIEQGKVFLGMDLLLKLILIVIVVPKKEILDVAFLWIERICIQIPFLWMAWIFIQISIISVVGKIVNVDFFTVYQFIVLGRYMYSPILQEDPNEPGRYIIDIEL